MLPSRKMHGLKNSQGLRQTCQVFTGVKLLWVFVFSYFFPFLFFFLHRRRGREKTRKEGTKAKVCFGMNETDELPFQTAKQCLHPSNRKVSPWSNLNKMSGVFNGNSGFGQLY